MAAFGVFLASLAILLTDCHARSEENMYPSRYYLGESASVDLTLRTSEAPMGRVLRFAVCGSKNCTAFEFIGVRDRPDEKRGCYNVYLSPENNIALHEKELDSSHIMPYIQWEPSKTHKFSLKKSVKKGVNTLNLYLGDKAIVENFGMESVHDTLKIESTAGEVTVSNEMYESENFMELQKGSSAEIEIRKNPTESRGHLFIGMCAQNNERCTIFSFNAIDPKQIKASYISLRSSSYTINDTSHYTGTIENCVDEDVKWCDKCTIKLNIARREKEWMVCMRGIRVGGTTEVEDDQDRLKLFSTVGPFTTAVFSDGRDGCPAGTTDPTEPPTTSSIATATDTQPDVSTSPTGSDSGQSTATPDKGGNGASGKGVNFAFTVLAVSGVLLFKDF